MKISKADKNRIIEIIPEAKKHFEKDDVRSLLEMIEDFTIADIIDNDDEPTEIGREFELIYDRIYSENY